MDIIINVPQKSESIGNHVSADQTNSPPVFSQPTGPFSNPSVQDPVTPGYGGNNYHPQIITDEDDLTNSVLSNSDVYIDNDSNVDITSEILIPGTTVQNKKTKRSFSCMLRMNVMKICTCGGSLEYNKQSDEPVFETDMATANI